MTEVSGNHKPLVQGANVGGGTDRHKDLLICQDPVAETAKYSRIIIIIWCARDYLLEDNVPPLSI